MVAIGDAEGTVSIMQLCKPLYEQAPKEKDEMNKIFDREFRREKALDNAKKAAKEAEKMKRKAQPKKQVVVETPEQIEARKATEMKKRITDLEENFFQKVPLDEEDIAKAQAAGFSASARREPEAASAEVKAEGEEGAAASDVLIIDLPEGDYKLTSSFGDEFTIKIVAGGIIEGESLGGTINDGNGGLIIDAFGVNYTGNWTTEVPHPQAACIKDNTGEKIDWIFEKA